MILVREYNINKLILESEYGEPNNTLIIDGTPYFFSEECGIPHFFGRMRKSAEFCNLGYRFLIKKIAIFLYRHIVSDRR